MVDKVLHAQMPFTTGKQTINDRLTAAYHSLAGSQLGKTVCKATTEEEIGPKKKHLDYLLHCTNEPNVSIPQLANLLIERTTNTNWCTVFKSLITIHNLMCYGNERFSQYLASSNVNFNLVNFLDKNSVQGYDMSTHVRRYAKYISEKIYTYRMMAFDFCKVKRGREDGLLRTMPTERLLKTLPLLQSQIDSLLEFQTSSSDLNNGVINSCFILLFRDLIRLFACYNDGVINLLEKYFDMNKKQCREALDLYKGFLVRMDKVADFLKVAESVGIDKCEIPDLARAPSSLVEALEQHLAALEGQKSTGGTGQGSGVTSPTSNFAAQTAIQKLSSMEGFTAAIDANRLDEQAKMKILQEEEEHLRMLKEQRLRELEVNRSQNNRSSGPPSSGINIAKNNPFLQTPETNSSAKTSSIDDLLSLDFSTPVTSVNPSVFQQSTQKSTNPFESENFSSHASLTGPSSFGADNYSNGHVSSANAPKNFATDDGFARAFNSTQPIRPQGLELSSSNVSQQQLQRPPSQPPIQAKQQISGKLLKGDLDSSLASLAENLNITKSQEALKNKPVQWNATKLSQQQHPSYQQYHQTQYNPMAHPSTNAPYGNVSYGQQVAPQMPGVGGMGWGHNPGMMPQQQQTQHMMTGASYYGQAMPSYGAPTGAMSYSMPRPQQPPLSNQSMHPFGNL